MSEWVWSGGRRPVSRVQALSRRFWGAIGERLLDSGALDGTQYRPGQSDEELARRTEYATRWAYYENRELYRNLAAARLRPVAMATEWNPVPATVAFYVANTLADAAVEPGAEAANPEALSAAVSQVWLWSNWPSFQRDVVETAAVLGDVFVKVAEKAAAADTPATSVYLQSISPERVRWWDADERDFLTGIRIDTPRMESVFTGETRRHTLVEVWRKGWPDGDPGGVRWYEVAPGRPVDDERLGDAVRAQTFEELGYDFIPVVWARMETPWWRVTDQIDQYNRLGHLMLMLNRPTAVVHGRHVAEDGRPMPAPAINITELETTYQEAADGAFAYLRIPGNAQFTWAQSPIDLGAAGAQQARVRSGVETALPEYRVAELDVSQVAASTLEMLLDQAGQRVLALREVLERALARAGMMAITLAQLNELEGFEPAVIGTFESGALEHGFRDRGVFKPSVSLAATVMRDLVAAGVPVKLAMQKAGFTDEEVDGFDAAAAEQALRERTTVAAQLVRQRALVDSGAGDNGVTRP